MGVLYEHWRLDTNECFYVGKASGKKPYARAYNLNRPNKHHRSIVKKLRPLGLIEVRTVEFPGINKKSLSNLEILMIAHWRLYIGDRLSNGTAGGEGASPGDDNFMKKPEIVAKISGKNHYTYKSKDKMDALVGRMTGETNPAKSPEAAAKISKRKKGVPKPYFSGKNNPACKPGVGDKISAAWERKSQEEKNELVARREAKKAAKSDEEKSEIALKRSISIKLALSLRTFEQKAQQVSKCKNSLSPEKLKARAAKAIETRRRNKEMKLAAGKAAADMEK